MVVKMSNIISSFMLLMSSNTLICLCSDSILEDTELILAFMVHRHGDRAPVDNTIRFAMDPDKVLSSTAKYGFGQLTDAGIQRSYELGKSIRRRYGSYLSPQYNKSEIYIRSTDSTRTKMTVLTAMSAVYPAGKDNWSTDINWTPVPYTTVPAINDHNLAVVNCPVFIEAYHKALQETVPEMTAKYSALLNHLSEVIGLNITSIPTVVYSLYDVFISQTNLGIPLGEALEPYLHEIAEAAADSMDIIFGNEKYIALEAGVLLKEFFDAADKMIAGERVPKIQVHSAHDANVFAFTAVTKILNKQGVPRYGSLYSLELRKELATGAYIIVPVYFMEPGVDEIYLQVAGCEGFCDLESFRNLTADYVLDVRQWRTLCQFSEDYNFDLSSID